MTTIYSLRHPHLPESQERLARKALNMDALLIAPLPSGEWIVADRNLTHFTILQTFPNIFEFPVIKSAIDSARIAGESHYLGEPSTADLARDIREINRQGKTRQLQNVTLDLNLDLDP